MLKQSVSSPQLCETAFFSLRSIYFYSESLYNKYMYIFNIYFSESICLDHINTCIFNINFSESICLDRIHEQMSCQPIFRGKNEIGLPWEVD